MGLLKFSFAVDQIQPPALYYIRPGDRLLINSRCSRATFEMEIHGTIIGPDGRVHEISELTQSGTSLTDTNKRFPLGEGMLTHLTITSPTVNVYRGECFVRALLVRGLAGEQQAYAHLISGYLTRYHSPSYPPTRIESSLDGHGFLTRYELTNPDPGEDFSQAITASTICRLQSIGFYLNTDSNVADRYPGIYFQWGTGRPFYFSFANAHPADTNRYYVLSPGMSPETLNYNAVNASIADFRLDQDCTIRSSTLSIQAGDQYSGIQINVEQWIRD